MTTLTLCLRAMSVLGGLGALLAVAAPAGQDTASAVDLDHVILGIDDLDRGLDRFEALTGVRPMRGGEHPGRGTRNALVSLGPGHYLEILAPSASARSAAGDARTRHADLTLAGWALHTRGLDEVVARLRKAGFVAGAPASGSRRTPDGALLQWRSSTVVATGLELAPFFIEWAAGSAHPSTSSPEGCRLVSLELVQPDPSRLTAFFDAAGYAPVVRTGPEQRMDLVLECSRGPVTFSNR